MTDPDKSAKLASSARREATRAGGLLTGALSGASPSVHSPRATVAIGFVRGMLSGLCHQGIDPVPLLEAAGIAATVIEDPAARVPVDRYAALYTLLNRQLDDEAFGLFATPMRCGSYEFLCRSVITAPTLADALERSSRFLRLVLPDLAVSLERDRGEARLRIVETRPLNIGRVFAFEWLLRLLHGLSSWLVGIRIVLDAATFPYPVSYTHLDVYKRQGLHRAAHRREYPFSDFLRFVFGRLASVVQLELVDLLIDRGVEIERQDDRRRPVDCQRDRGGRRAQIEAVEQHLHVVERGDRDTRIADLAVDCLLYTSRCV